MNYIVTAHVEGVIDVEVEANSAEEAEEMVRARDFDTSLNTMDISDIETVSVKDEAGNTIIFM